MNTLNIKSEVVRSMMAEKLPCTGCEHDHKCGIDLKACADFNKYFNTGRFDAGTVRKPTRKMYMQLFWGGRD